MKVIVALLSVLVLATAHFENTEVQILTETNFEDRVSDSESLWLVFFYQTVDEELSQIVENTALALRNMVSLGATDSQTIAERHSITELPSFQLFAFNRDAPIAFSGEHTAENLVNFVFEHARNV
jgi:hypothetical protein